MIRNILIGMGIILLFLFILCIGLLFQIVLAVRDMNTDFVSKHNITEVDCSILVKEITDLDMLCGRYFTRNRQYYCKRNITDYYLSKCMAVLI